MSNYFYLSSAHVHALTIWKAKILLKEDGRQRRVTHIGNNLCGWGRHEAIWADWFRTLWSGTIDQTTRLQTCILFATFPYLTHLNLQGLKLYQNGLFLQLFIGLEHSNLLELNLQETGMDSRTLSHLLYYWPISSTIEVLNISDNIITFQGFQDLVQALTYTNINTLSKKFFLRVLDISYNSIPFSLLSNVMTPFLLSEYNQLEILFLDGSYSMFDTVGGFNSILQSLSNNLTLHTVYLPLPLSLNNNFDYSLLKTSPQSSLQQLIFGEHLHMRHTIESDPYFGSRFFFSSLQPLKPWRNYCNPYIRSYPWRTDNFSLCMIAMLICLDSFEPKLPFMVQTYLLSFFQPSLFSNDKFLRVLDFSFL